MKSLYITHYGILEPLGQSQILPYLIGLAENGCSIEIISFEKPALLDNGIKVEAQKDLLLSAGISWHPRPYRGGNSLSDLLRLMLRTSAEISRRCLHHKIDIVHCRSHVPCLMAWLSSPWHKKPILFDFRGFLAEEYADAGLWQHAGFRFRSTKALERILLKQCKALVVLTNPARDHFCHNYSMDAKKIFVIPCCADLSRYALKPDATSTIGKRPLHVVYSGSTVGRYDLPAMLSFFSLVLKKRPDSRFTILSTSDLSQDRTVLDKFHLHPDSVSVVNARHQEMPSHLAAQDLGLIMLKGDLALSVASPTKIGEYLASGLVVVAEEALGDMHKILVDSGCGILINSSCPETWEAAADAAIDLCDQSDFRKKSRLAAEQYLDLNAGIQKYLQAYRFALGLSAG